MFDLRLIRILVIAALVFSQTLSAAHNQLHDNNGPSVCQICLHASLGSAALIPAEEAISFSPHRPHFVGSYAAPEIPGIFASAHPSRAPPYFTV